jgi:endonuclease I
VYWARKHKSTSEEERHRLVKELESVLHNRFAKAEVRANMDREDADFAEFLDSQSRQTLPEVAIA